LMEQYKINGLLVTDDHNKLVGAFNMHDLLIAKII
jgi:CBS domain-containing protein